MLLTDMTDDALWFKDAVIYQLHVKAFLDMNGDGTGDFRGLAEKADYLQELGITAIWLLPFYPSPMRDDGYDIADYRNVNSAYGVLRDFRAFLDAAHRRGIRVITELVVNHTSDQHPWFKRARAAKPDSAWRDYYVWSDTDQKYCDTRIIFTDTESSNWTWDPIARAYYWHRFFSHQPDLNFDNPRVIDSMARIMRFWFDMGVDGLRLDAIPYLCEREGTNCENLAETHAVVRKLRSFLDERYEDRMFLAEANQWPEDVLPYFGNGDECHMAFHFPLMPRIYMALAQEDRHPVTDIMRQTPDIPGCCQWAIFLRNHDELTLEMVTDRERDYLWQFYATDPRARLNLGIRRRLAPLLDNDRRKVELMNSLLMSMPGTPIVYYGDEIGMGDNVYLGDRDGVRTPMQWTPDRNGGFSRADPARLYLPPIMDPVYGYEAVNVEAQTRSPSSLLNWMKRLIAVRRQHSSFGRGVIRFLYPGNRKVLAYLREHDGETILCVANLSRAPQPVELDLSEFRGRVPIELIGRSAFPPIGELPYFVTLAAYGFYWFLLEQEAEAPIWHESHAPPPPELLTLVIPQGWQSLADGAAREALESRILPGFLPGQRWFAGKGAAIASIREADLAEIRPSGPSLALATFEVVPRGAAAQLYSLPLGIAWEEGGEDPLLAVLPFALGRVRRGARLGVLFDAATDSALVRGFVDLIRGDAEYPTAGGGCIRFRGSKRLLEAIGEEPIDGLEVRRIGGEQSNSSSLVGNRMVLKFYRRLQRGEHPELEIAHHLTDVAGYANTPALLGAIEHHAPDGERTALGILQAFVNNQGDGWHYTLDYLDRQLEQAELAPVDGTGGEGEPHGPYLALMRTLGERTAELHRAFAIRTNDPAFRPERAGKRDIARWTRRVREGARQGFRALRHAQKTLAGPLKAEVRDLIALRPAILERIGALAPETIEIVKTRYHGDFHLGQVVVVKNDFHILDFEGEPSRSVAERRAKGPPLRDVAGLVRSLDYAAWAAVLERTRMRPEHFDLLWAAAREWRDHARAAFLEGYGAAIGDCPSYPQDEEAAQRLLELFVLEKAFYEIAYEADNRPDWLRIPVRGVLGFFARGD